jgi:hypothetical protein
MTVAAPLCSGVRKMHACPKMDSFNPKQTPLELPTAATTADVPTQSDVRR